MPQRDVLEVLRSRGEVWEVAPGLTALRGHAARLHSHIERRIAELCLVETGDEWIVPPALSLATLERAEYFASCPQWLTLAAHLDGDEHVLRGIAESASPSSAAAAATAPTSVALTPAVCCHVYEALAGQRLGAPRLVTAQSACWRHEGDRHAPLERGWAFTMREIVCVGTDIEVRAFVNRVQASVTAFAESLGLLPVIEQATDPFFAPTARGKLVLQQLKGLKRELLLPVDANRTIAAASFNLHETFFGNAFDIRTAAGTPACTGCVAFGIERWTLALLACHGPDPDHWPDFTRDHAHRGAAR
jgi:seryl-tRNA synthetase